MKIKLFNSAALMPFVLLPAVAHAQEIRTDPALDATQEVSQQADPSSSEIIVTATRREASLQKVPVAVTAVSNLALTTSGVENVRSLNLVAPGYNGGRNQNVMQPSIRGVGSNGTSVGDESNVAVYVDGIYQGDPYSTQIDLVEISRIEVLRGPQGTVFGRNATGGLVNVVTPDPQFNSRGRIKASGARTRERANNFDISGYVTGGLTDTIAADLAVLYRNQDGYAVNLFKGGTVGDRETISVRSKLLFQPSDTAKFVLTVGYVDTHEETAALGQPYKGNTLGAKFDGAIVPNKPWQVSNFVAASGTAGLSDYTRLDLALKGQLDLGGVILESTSSYMRTRVNQNADSDGTNLLLGETDMRVRPDTFTQELRLVSDNSGPLSWTAGLYYYELEGEQPLTLINRQDPSLPIVPTRMEPKVSTASYAAFAEGTYELMPRFSITLGGRFTTEKRKFSQRINGNQLFTDAEKKFDKFTYRVSLQYEASPDLNIYGTYGTGFKSGVFNTFSPSRVAVDPETIEAFEFGIKSEPLSWLRANLATFYYKYDDMQVTARGGDNSFVLQNAAKAKIYGGELELTTEPVTGLNLRSAIAYTHSEYDKFTNAQVFIPRPGGGNLVSSVDASGNQLIRTPEFTLTLGGRYSFDAFDGKAFLGGNIFHSSPVYYDYLNTFKQDSYELISSEIGWTTPNDDLTFRIFAKNLTNEAVAQQISPGPLGAYIIYERPREVGASVEIKF
ncbi:TonB-dependent receptor [Novosphingobium soli]|uniref:TonB-dependent receptor n=1 Tax=Novosphingobium soli TaxID=574956 RepID=A0ABV6D1M4_9SPHN|tara:strand:- start:3923 stop:6115 length:2193 start_codon:yes stop_codon:yes gene_type:complete